jgi:S1-C subfamily serine protease
MIPRLLLAFKMFFCMAAFAAAEVPQSALCRVTVHEPGGRRSLGSGTVVRQENGYGLVVTCQHLFDNPHYPISCTFIGDKRTWPATVGEICTHADLAAIWIASPPSVCTVGEEPCEQYECAGFGDPRGLLAISKGVYLRCWRDHGGRANSFEASCLSRSGDSGGGVFDPQGRLVGVIWGGRDGHCWFTRAAVVRSFLDRQKAPKVKQ